MEWASYLSSTEGIQPEVPHRQMTKEHLQGIIEQVRFDWEGMFGLGGCFLAKDFKWGFD